jgi:hypothetical protein
MGSPINWSVAPGSKVLLHPIYAKYSVLPMSTIVSGIAAVKQDLGICLASNESADVIAYLAWLIRLASLLGG